MSQTAMSHVHTITPIDEAGVVRCYTHCLPASLRTSQTSKNYNRKFYCCSKGIDDPNRCTFFVWVDDPIFKSSKQPSSTAKDPPLSPPPSSPATTAPPTTPRKRGFQPSSDLSSPELTPSQKRTKLIKEALSGTSTPPQTPSRMRQLEASPSRSQRSQRRLEDIQLGLSLRRSRSPVRLNTQHDTLNPSQSGDSSRSLTLSQPSNYKTSLQPVNTNHKAPDDDDDDDDAALWAQVTPPPSDSAELGPLSDEHGRNAGTVLFASEKGRLHWQHDDPDNLFDETQSQVTNSTSRSHPYCVPSTELSTELSADTISTLLDRMDGIPDYVRKLERKKIAAEKSNEAKAKRIAELEKEVERLQVANRALRESVDSPTSRRHGI